MKLSIVVPVFNEENTIKRLLDRVFSEVEKLKKKKVISGYVVIVVDDGSRDGTVEIIEKLKHKNLKLFIHKENIGKGAALRRGFRESKGDVIITQDADLEYDPKYYGELLRALDTPRADGPPISEKGSSKVVYGSRIGDLPLNWETLKTIPLPFHFLSNKFLSWFTSILYGQKVTDMETGYKVFRREVLDFIDLESDGFEIEVELTVKTIKAGYTIKEVPITTNPRGYDEGKKIGFWDGVEAIKQLIRYRIDSYHFAIIGILTLSLILRFWDFTNRYGLWSDQARDVLVGRIANQTLSPPMVGSFSSGGPFTFGPIWYYYAMITDAFPGGHMNYWIGMGLLSTTMILGIVIITRKISGRFASLVAGVLSAISLYSIELSLSSTQHSLVPIMITGFILSSIYYMRNKHVVLLSLSGLFLSSAINSHYQAIYLLPMFALLLLYKRPSIKHLSGLFIAMLVPTIPMLWFDITHEWWNLFHITDYYRFGQYRLYVPNRWLTYAGEFWPQYWSRVVGGGLVFAFVAMIGSALLFWYNFLKGKLHREIIWIVFGFFISFVWFRYFRAERTFGYVSYAMPFIIIITSWFIDQLYNIDKKLGLATLGLFVFGSYMQLINHADVRNSYEAISSLKEGLTQEINAPSYAIYDQGFATNGCSISLSLMLDDQNKSDTHGYPVGMCETNVCPANTTILTTTEVGGFSCSLVDLTPADIELTDAWVLVSPEEVHRMTVDWWKSEPKLQKN